MVGSPGQSLFWSGGSPWSLVPVGDPSAVLDFFVPVPPSVVSLSTYLAPWKAILSSHLSTYLVSSSSPSFTVTRLGIM